MNRDKFKSCTEMFPQLADKQNRKRFVEFIKVNDLRLFCEKCLEKSGKEIGTGINNDVAEAVLDIMIRKELLTPNNHQTYVDALLVAAQLFDIYYFYGEDNVHDLFKARVEFDEIADLECYEHGPIPEQFREMVWDTIEGQLGDCTPMSKTKPSPNTPQDLFATAIWTVRRYFRKIGEDGLLIKQMDSAEDTIAELEAEIARWKSQ